MGLPRRRTSPRNASRVIVAKQLSSRHKNRGKPGKTGIFNFSSLCQPIPSRNASFPSSLMAQRHIPSGQNASAGAAMRAQERPFTCIMACGQNGAARSARLSVVQSAEYGSRKMISSFTTNILQRNLLTEPYTN